MTITDTTPAATRTAPQWGLLDGRLVRADDAGPGAGALPSTGDYVRLVASGEEAWGVWLTAYPTPEDPGQITVHLMRTVDGTTTEVVLPVTEALTARLCVITEAPEPVGPTDQHQALYRALAAALTATHDERTAHHRTVESHHASIASLTAALHEEADDRDYCSEFDEFMERNGLEPRTHTYAVTVRLSARTTVTVTARNPEEACDQVDCSTALGALEGHEVQIDDLAADRA